MSSCPPDWDKLGITFSVIPTSRFDEVCEMIHDNLCPDEPVTRSLRLCQPGSVLNRFMRRFYWKEFLKDGRSMMAVDKDNKVVGARVGRKVTKTAYSGIQRGDAWFRKSLSAIKCILPQNWKRMLIIYPLLEAAGYNVGQSFDKLGCNTIYESAGIVVGKDARGLGLGTELARRTKALAAECGCEYMYVCVTGEYSAKIFLKLGYTLDREFLYENFRDRNGKEILTDTREHKRMRVLYTKL